MKIVSLLVLGLIRGYQLLISPFLPPSCRFFPSCSDYARQAVASHGPLHGSWLALTRLLRCHPWGGLGYDPVPEKSPSSKITAGLGLCQDRSHVDHQAGR